MLIRIISGHVGYKSSGSTRMAGPGEIIDTDSEHAELCISYGMAEAVEADMGHLNDMMKVAMKVAVKEVSASIDANNANNVNESTPDEVHLEDMTNAQLKGIASSIGIQGTSRMNKTQLISAINAAVADVDADDDDCPDIIAEDPE